MKYLKAVIWEVKRKSGNGAVIVRNAYKYFMVLFICLFIYIILSPFLSKEERIKIFGEDLYERKDLLPMFLETTGHSKEKPFECVGTYEEARLAVCQAIKKGEQGYLLDYYKNHFSIEILEDSILKYNEENFIPDEYNELVKKEMRKYD